MKLQIIQQRNFGILTGFTILCFLMVNYPLQNSDPYACRYSNCQCIMFSKGACRMYLTDVEYTKGMNNFTQEVVYDVNATDCLKYTFPCYVMGNTVMFADNVNQLEMLKIPLNLFLLTILTVIAVVLCMVRETVNIDDIIMSDSDESDSETDDESNDSDSEDENTQEPDEIEEGSEEDLQSNPVDNDGFIRVERSRTRSRSKSRSPTSSQSGYDAGAFEEMINQ